jgi:redox-sensitive bicupin YhaK (pirin superfamily)
MKDVTRRDALRLVTAASAAAATACESAAAPREPEPRARIPADEDPVLSSKPLGEPPWETSDPFLFCVHHDDGYPRGNERFGPAESLAGRDLGQDFAGKDGWRMYHGREVPGFQRHPHRGFETVTVVRRGLLDHSDSMGAAARYGRGDVQWLTAGSGIQHAEMFPLLDPDRPNPVELFQIWLNLPAAKKMAEPHFSMLWSDTIPRIEARDAAGALTVVTIVAGRLGDRAAPPPPPSSWAARADSHVAIWTIKMAPRARFALPRATGTNRALYFFRGETLAVGRRSIDVGRRIELAPDHDVALENGSAESELLLLQGRPIAEPIERHGPFVMNTRDEIRRAYEDYRQTGFGGWPWKSHDPVHGAVAERFARRPDGKVERPA